MRIDSIFFDVDGTLVNSTADIANAVNYTLGALKLPALSQSQVASYIGTGTKDLLDKSLGAGNAALAGKALNIFGEYYAKHSTDKSVLYPHVREILEYLKDKKKYILTNRYAKFADITLKGLDIRRYFEDVFGGDDENCLKPSACVIDSITAKLGIDKSNALIVGDMAIDIMTGRNSGIKTCWARYGLGKSEDVLPLRPDFVIDDLIELKKIIN